MNHTMLSDSPDEFHSCENNPSLVVIGTLTEWRATCRACPAGMQWHSGDTLNTPMWVLDYVHAVFAGQRPVTPGE